MTLRRQIAWRVGVYLGIPLLATALVWAVSIRMPGASHEGPLPPLTPAERESSERLRAHVDALAGRIGDRNAVRRAALDSAADYIRATLESHGYRVIGFVGNVSSRALVHRVVRDFRAHARFPSAGTAAWTRIPGVSWSDHWSFWVEGYDAVMITDTAPFRNDNYHQRTDRPDSLDYDRMARVVGGVERVVRTLASRSDH